MDNGKDALNLDQLGRVTGGTADSPDARYRNGYCVQWNVHRKYVTGRIQLIHRTPHGYQYTVKFDEITAKVPESELSPAGSHET